MRSRHHALRFVVIAAVAACGGAPEAQDQSENVQAVTARSHEQVARWFELASPEVLALPGTVFAAHDEATNRVLVGVENAAAINGAPPALPHRGGPTSAFAIQETEPIYQLATLRVRFRPTGAGV